MTGYARQSFEQLDGEALCSAIPPEDFAQIKDRFTHMLETGAGMDCDFRFEGRKAVFWAHMAARVIDQRNGAYLVNASFFDFTEEKRLSEKLPCQSFCLDMIDRSLSSAVIIKEPGFENAIRYVSSNVLNMLGYSAEDAGHVYGDSYKNVIYLDDYQKVVDLIEQHKRNKPQHFEIEYRLVKADGSVIWVREAADRLDDFVVDNAYLIIFTDITDLKNVEMRLRVQNEEYRVAVLHGKDIIARYSIAQGVLCFPKEIAAMNKLPEKLEDMPCRLINEAIISSGSVENYIRIFDCAGRGENCSAEIEARWTDGKQRWFYAASTVIFDDRNAPVSAVISFSDITEKKRTEQKMNDLKETEQLFRAVAENVSILALRYDFSSDSFEPYGNVSQTVFSDLSGPYTADRIINSGLFETDSMNDLYAFYRDIKKGTAKGSLIVRARSHDNMRVWYKCSFINVFDRQHSPGYTVIICEDVTGRRENELALQLFQGVTKPGSRGIEVNLEYNLTADSIERIDGDMTVFSQEIINDSYTNALSKIAICLPPGEQEAFMAKMSRNKLLADFEADVNSGTCEITIRGRDGDTWIRVYYQMLREPYTDQIGLWLSCSNIDKEKKSELKLTEMAQIDAVTGCYNRAGFKARVQEKNDTADKNRMCVFILLDIDDFGRINDMFGHVYGDQVLRELSQTLTLLLTKNDVVARIFGGEFAIYATGFTDLSVINERLRILIAAVYRDLKAGVKLSVSAGVAISPNDGTAIAALYEKADTALRCAKLTGRNKYVLYHEDLAPVYGPGAITPINEDVQKSTGVYIRTFGYFDVFVNGEVMLIPNAKAKELLALLVDRRGGYVTSAELIASLWEDQPANKVTLARCRKMVLLLRNVLKEYGMEDLMESQKGSRRINTSLVNCDLYNYLSGKAEYAHLFKGSYMLNYSWGELTVSELEWSRGAVHYKSSPKMPKA